MLERESGIEGGLELCYFPFALADGLRASIDEPPATMLLLPNGWVKVAAALPQVCADLRRHTLQQSWQRYRSAWRNDEVIAEARRAVVDESRHAAANAWKSVSIAVTANRTEAA
jgi:hypothetical protein